MNANQILLTRYSLAFLWIFTAITSAFFDMNTGLEVLANKNIQGSLAKSLIYSGSLVDLVIGFWLLSNKHQKLCCDLQVITIILFSILLFWIDASFWLHPFGPITKNIPIIVLILIYRNTGQNN